MIIVILLFFITLLFPYPTQAVTITGLPQDSVARVCESSDILSGAYDPNSGKLVLDIKSSFDSQVSPKTLTLDKISNTSSNFSSSKIVQIAPGQNPLMRAVFNIPFDQFKAKIGEWFNNNQTTIKQDFDYKLNVGNNQNTTPCNNGNDISDPEVPIVLATIEEPPPGAPDDQAPQVIPVQGGQQNQLPAQQQIPLPGAGLPALPSIPPLPSIAPHCTPAQARRGLCTLSGGEPCDLDPNNPGLKTAIGCVHTNPAAFTKDLLRFAVAVSGGLGFLMMVFGAYQLLTSSGNPDTLKAGQDRLTNAIVGLLIIIFAVLLMQIIGIQILNIPGFGP